MTSKRVKAWAVVEGERPMAHQLRGNRYCGRWVKLNISFHEWFYSNTVRNKVNGCIEWKVHNDAHGYGRVVMPGGTAVVAHRLAWEMKNSQPVPDGMVVCHSCDNPSCVNPDHLWVGTQHDNSLDCHVKGRSALPVAWELKRKRTHCKRGHIFSPENTLLESGKHGPTRRCVTCYELSFARRAAHSPDIIVEES